MKIALGCDHGALELKNALIPFLRSLGHSVEDFGTYTPESCDYPDYAVAAAQAVADGDCDRGIVLCTTGIGVSIAANKVRGIRCALLSDLTSARMTRLHNDTNMMALGAGVVSQDLAFAIVDTWLSTPFSNEDRHQRRIDKVMSCERGLKKKRRSPDRRRRRAPLAIRVPAFIVSRLLTLIISILLVFSMVIAPIATYVTSISDPSYLVNTLLSSGLFGDTQSPEETTGPADSDDTGTDDTVTDDTVTDDTVTDDTVTDDTVTDDTVTDDTVTDDTVTDDTVTDDTVTDDTVTDDTVTDDTVTDDTVTDDTVTDDTVTDDTVTVFTLTNRTVLDDTATDDTVTDDTVTDDTITDDTVTDDTVTDDTVTDDTVTDDTVTDDTVTDDTVTDDTITDDTVTDDTVTDDTVTDDTVTGDTATGETQDPPSNATDPQGLLAALQGMFGSGMIDDETLHTMLNIPAETPIDTTLLGEKLLASDAAQALVSAYVSDAVDAAMGSMNGPTLTSETVMDIVTPHIGQLVGIVEECLPEGTEIDRAAIEDATLQALEVALPSVVDSLPDLSEAATVLKEQSPQIGMALDILKFIRTGALRAAVFLVVVVLIVVLCLFRLPGLNGLRCVGICGMVSAALCGGIYLLLTMPTLSLLLAGFGSIGTVIYQFADAFAHEFAVYAVIYGVSGLFLILGTTVLRGFFGMLFDAIFSRD